MSIAEEFRPHEGMDFESLHGVLRKARESDAVFYWPPMDMWAVSRHEDVIAVLQDGERFTSEGVLSYLPFTADVQALLDDAGTPTHHDTNWMGFIDGAEHKAMRSAVNRAFTPRRVNALEPLVRQLTHELLDATPTREPVDLKQALTYPLPILVILAFLQVPRDDMDELKRWSDDLTRFISKPVPPEEQMVLAESTVKFDRYAQALIEERRARPGEDFLSALIADADSGENPWTDREIRYFIAHGLILAGHETTDNTMANGLSHLLRDRSLWTSVVEQPDRIPAVVEEILRYDPPIVGYFRRTKVPVEIGGVSIPADQRLYLLFASANHDERRYSCPHQFETTRPQEEQFHLAFSYGSHYCLGAAFARLELRVALSTLAERFPRMTLAPEWRPVYKPNPLTRHLESLQVVLDPAS